MGILLAEQGLGEGERCRRVALQVDPVAMEGIGGRDAVRERSRIRVDSAWPRGVASRWGAPPFSPIGGLIEATRMAHACDFAIHDQRK